MYLSKLSGKLIYLDVSLLTATCSSDLIATLRGGPYTAVTQLRDNPSCKPSFLEMHLAQGVTFWVPTHAPQPLVTRQGLYLPSSRTTHMVPPWAWPSHGSYLSQGSPRGGVGTSQVRLLLTDTGNMALKPPFSFLYHCSEVLRPLTVSPPPRSFLPVGIGG